MTTKVAKQLDFSFIKNAVTENFSLMQTGTLYKTSVDKDLLWSTYIDSFPAGSNQMFRKRTDHDCSCCKQFIRIMGGVVAIIDGKMVSIWDNVDDSVDNRAYSRVAAAMSDLVHSSHIENVFLHYEKTIGTDKNFEGICSGDNVLTYNVLTWQHYFVSLDTKHRFEKKYIPARLGEIRGNYEVAYRGLKELSMDSIDTVLELIAQNSLYRGEEHKGVLVAFKKVKQMFDELPKKRKPQSHFVWENIDNGALRIRNTVIGTLLIDLSAGMELEGAVKSFEQKVAPTNYKRPSALITKSMIENARKTIDELGLTSSLQRRYATIDDISINNVLFADRSLRKKLGGENIFDELIQKTGSTIKDKKLDKIEEIPIDRFVNEVLPKADSIEVLFEGRLQNNLVSLIAPVEKKAGKLFKWNNRFSWSYNGELTDSIKERVKQAGGSVVGDLCNRLAWSNYDDLDLHVIEPDRYELYYGTKYTTSPSGGRLDVDMNAGAGGTRDPVENIFYTDWRKMKPGTYTLYVHQFQPRETQDIGFEAQVDWMNEIHQYSYKKRMAHGDKVVVAKMILGRDGTMQIASDLDSTRLSKEVWGIHTTQFQKVQAIMLSPNHWDDKQVGNRHWFFMLDQCKNDGAARGFYNEFLTEDLTKHRKVFEIIGSKTKVEESDNQLSGLGFSSTKNDYLVVRVKGSFTRELKIVF